MDLQAIAKAMMELSDDQLSMGAILSSGSGADDFCPIVGVLAANHDRLSLNADAAGLDQFRLILAGRDYTSKGLTLRSMRDGLTAASSKALSEPAIVSIGDAPYVQFYEVDALGMSGGLGDVAKQRFGDDQPIILYKPEPITAVYGQIMEAMNALTAKDNTTAIAKCVLYLLCHLNGPQLRDAINFCKTVT